MAKIATSPYKYTKKTVAFWHQFERTFIPPNIHVLTCANVIVLEYFFDPTSKSKDNFMPCLEFVIEEIPPPFTRTLHNKTGISNTSGNKVESRSPHV